MSELSTLQSFADLISAVPGARLVGSLSPSRALIDGLFSDSRALRPGGLFIAVRGQQHDGHRHIPQAVQQGAVAVVGEDEAYLQGLPVPAAVVPDARQAMGLLASAFHGFPSHRLGMIGVTGTDGKTTTTHLIAALLQEAGFSTGVLSTISVGVGAQLDRNETPFTTPEALEVQRRLAEMAAAGCRYVALEVSSHAIATHRVAGCAFDVAAFTNLTPEHLDYHQTVEEYFETKAKLFRGLGRAAAKPVPPAAVVNLDEPWGRELAQRSDVPVYSYGLESQATLVARDISLYRDGTRFTVVGPSEVVPVRAQLIGRHNVYNWLAAMAVGLSQGLDLRLMAEIASRTAPVRGRLQWVERGQPFAVLVDFAHTPNALRQTLAFLRGWTQGRVIVVLGHAGGRDLNNRPLMGTVAAELADYFIITTDDPGDEDPSEIAEVVASGARAAGAAEGRDYAVVLDRRDAFAAAFSAACPGDTVLLAGRGHERYMPVAKGQRVPFDDAEVAFELLSSYSPPTV